MKQATTTNENEKIDPLTRIQEEIKEVKRREQEYHRQLTAVAAPTSLIDFDDNENDINSNNNNHNNNIEQLDDHDHHQHQHQHHDDNGNDSNNSLSISPVPPATTAATEPAVASVTVAVVTSLVVLDDNASSLASSVNSKESLDEHHSDDSGISASSSPVDGNSAHAKHDNGNNNMDGLKTSSAKQNRYIGPNCYNMTPEPPQQKLMARTVSTPHLAASKPRQFAYNPAHKGVMQRFIASRGKLQLNNNNSSNAAANQILLNGNLAAALINGGNAAVQAAPTNTPLVPTLNTTLLTEFTARDPSAIILPTVTLTRDAEGRPIRPGYVPVELKIQRELKDLKSRESELKKIRKIRLSTPDLLDSIDNDNVETDDDEDSEVEHCYGPGQLRSAKSIGELCDASQSNHSISPRATPSPDFHHRLAASRSGGMRPAMSLAQLCDLDPEEAPSSHRLIAQWESLIQQNA